MLSLGKKLRIGVGNGQEVSESAKLQWQWSASVILGQNSFNFHVIKSTQTQSTMQYYMLYSFYCCVLHKHVFTPNDAKEEVPAVFTG